MTNKVYTADTESVSQVRIVHQGKDFLGGSNSQFPPNLNRYKQSQINSALRQTDISLTTDLKALFIARGLNLTAMRIFHNSPFLAQCLGSAKYTGLANGFTFIVFEFDNHPKLFEFTICNVNDKFSRLEGRVYAKRKAYHAIRRAALVEGTLNFGLNIYPDHEKNEQKLQSSITPFKIGNHIVKRFIKKPVEKLESYVNPLIGLCEDSLLIGVKKHLIETQGLVPESIRLYTQYVRRYDNSLFKGLLGTPEFFKNLNDEGKELISTGGFTVYGILGTKVENGETEVFITFSRCSDEEGFNKSYGRKQCLKNFLDNKFNPYTLKKELPSISSALIQILETYINRGINIEITPKVSDLIPK